MKRGSPLGARNHRASNALSVGQVPTRVAKPSWLSHSVVFRVTVGNQMPRYHGIPPGWEGLESVEAKRLRGKGWSTFARSVRGERGRRCQICGNTESRRSSPRSHAQLHVHHILRVDAHRHLQFERSNVVVLCQPCHHEAELGEYSQEVLSELARSGGCLLEGSGNN